MTASVCQLEEEDGLNILHPNGIRLFSFGHFFSHSHQIIESICNKFKKINSTHC